MIQVALCVISNSTQTNVYNYQQCATYLVYSTCQLLHEVKEETNSLWLHACWDIMWQSYHTYSTYIHSYLCRLWQSSLFIAEVLFSYADKFFTCSHSAEVCSTNLQCHWGWFSQYHFGSSSTFWRLWLQLHCDSPVHEWVSYWWVCLTAVTGKDWWSLTSPLHLSGHFPFPLNSWLWLYTWSIHSGLHCWSTACHLDGVYHGRQHNRAIRVLQCNHYLHWPTRGCWNCLT